ncbi:MAG: SpoIID/LytB domain-containing protein [Actinobacteria bacterium]|nr:SpoIID/LytB domain-containing protein [Actinomycetota bacterium]
MSLAWSTVVRLLTVCSVLVALAAGAAWAHPAQSETMPGEAVFVVSGRGWGHGVGMSQYGAYGMANAGHSHEQILAHYYSGTEIGQAATQQVRVLLAEGKPAVTVSSAKPFSAIDARGELFKLAPGTLVLRPKLKLPIVDKPRPVKAAPPLLIRPGKDAPLSFDGVQYRGSLELAVQGNYLRVVNFVRLDAYLSGVVANEMPHTWPSEALEAQAVAARSYALANLVKGKPFDLYADVRSQVYRGVAGEKPRTSAAVQATAGQVVLYAGSLATTYYFSTSGGRTASAADVFGTHVPYLLSRPDPWDKASPHHMWGPFLYGARTLQSRLGVADRILDAVGVPTPSGRLRSITVQTEAGSSSVQAALLRTSLGLRSTWVTIGVLRLDQPRETIVFGSPLRLTGLARSLPAPMLSSSPDGSRWTGVGLFQRSTSGIASLVVKPERTLRYRIEVEGAASPAILVEVAPRVQLSRGTGALSLLGTVRPRLAGAPVFIERREGSTWRRVARKTVDTTGAFRAEVARQGEYRASIPATGAYAEAVTAALVVAG